MEFVTDDLVAEAQPTDEELGAYLNTHPHLFLVDGKLTFTQVFLDPQKARRISCATLRNCLLG
jgi:hypothetical protein